MVKEEGSVKVPVKLEQAWKADAPIEVTLLPRANEPVKPEQYLKALYPIVVTELGIVSEPVKPLQPLKASSPIAVTVYVTPLLVTVEGRVMLPVGWVYPSQGFVVLVPG